MDFSIVIPALNECGKIGLDVEAAAAFLAGQEFDGEIIVVDDGSTDGTAEAAAEVELPEGVRRRVIRHDVNRGKGCAVRNGVAASSGTLVMFADSGLCIPYDNALRGIELIRSGECDIAHGSRKLHESIIRHPRRTHRLAASWMFRHLVLLLMRIPQHYTDTQCGFKVYRGDVARELFAESVSDGFMFDVEVMLRALAKGYRVAEFPVDWTSDRDSRLRTGHTAMRVLSELTAIKRAIAAEHNVAAAGGSSEQ